MIKKFFAAFFAFFTVSVFFCNKVTEAADPYNAIYQTVSCHNSNSEYCRWITDAIFYASAEHQVDPILIAAVMEAESGFNFNAVSSVGAIGLMQLMPETAKIIGVNPYDALQNIIGGTIYLKTQLERFSAWGEYAVTDAVAAYNAGPQAVIRVGGVPNYSETRHYVINVAGNYNRILSLINS